MVICNRGNTSHDFFVLFYCLFAEVNNPQANHRRSMWMLDLGLILIMDKLPLQIGTLLHCTNMTLPKDVLTTALHHSHIIIVSMA